MTNIANPLLDVVSRIDLCVHRIMCYKSSDIAKEMISCSGYYEAHKGPMSEVKKS